MKTYLYHLLISISSFSCTREHKISMIFENSSPQPLKLVVSKNKAAIDTVNILEIRKQPVQVSIRKSYEVKEGDIFHFEELNTGKHFDKQIHLPYAGKTFVILGDVKGATFYLDTITYNREVETM